MAEICAALAHGTVRASEDDLEMLVFKGEKRNADEPEPAAADAT